MSHLYKIPFHKPTFLGEEFECLGYSIPKENCFVENDDCHHFFKEYFPDSKCIFTNSCTTALELSIRALGIESGDEVIIPGFGYVAVANAVVNNGAVPVFVDVNLENGNIDPSKVIQSISLKTKAVIGIHYASNPMDIESLVNICNDHKIYFIEDAAQCIGAKYKGKNLGSFGHIGCLSFDFMKNISCGQGGLVIINDLSIAEKIHTSFDNGTNRQSLILGLEKKFDWKSKGSNFQINPIATHFLSYQLKSLQEITETRIKNWNLYYKFLLPLEEKGKVILPHPIETHNGHIFYLIAESENQRSELRNFLRAKGIYSEHHYSSLASSTYGSQFVTSEVSLQNSEMLCTKLLRLPIWNQITEKDIETVSLCIHEYYAS